MNDYTAMKLHRMRVEEVEREHLIREAIQMPVADRPRSDSLARIVSLIIRRSKRSAAVMREVAYSPRTVVAPSPCHSPECA